MCVGVRKRECVNRDAYMAEILIHKLQIAYYVNKYTYELFSHIFTTPIREWVVSESVVSYITSSRLQSHPLTNKSSI